VTIFRDFEFWQKDFSFFYPPPGKPNQAVNHKYDFSSIYDLSPFLYGVFERFCKYLLKTMSQKSHGSIADKDTFWLKKGCHT